jgi:transposase InsO family protein
VDSQWRPVAYWSRKLTDTELRWATGQKELLAIVESLEHWSHYLEGTDRRFVVLTDHEALKGVVAAPARDLRGRLARWVYRLAGFDFDLEHRPGKTNPADPLSRRPDYMAREITYEDVLPTMMRKLQLAGDLSEPVLATVARIRAGEFKEACSRKYRRAVRRQCPRVDGEARVTAVTRSALGVSGRTAFVKSGASSVATGGIAAPSRGGLGRRTRSADSPERSVSLGRSSQRVEEQSQQGARCADLLIPHAVAAEVCAGEAVDAENPSHRFYQSVIALQQGDVDCCAKIDAALQNHVCPERRKGSMSYHVDDAGALRFKGRLVIPSVPAVRRELVRLHHDDPRAGHFGSGKTIDLLKRRFHWGNLDLDVQTYVNHCQICLGNRQPRHKPYGALSSLPFPTQPFEEISIDFITKLPPCQHQDRIVDAVLTVVDRFTKVALFIATTTTVTAAELAQLLYEHVECRFGTPLGIVSDRDSLLTSKFWVELAKAREVKQRLSTAYHPQTDGQAERTHQALQHYLRCFCGEEQQWAPLLKEAEFAYNNSVHPTIGVSPFEALYGYHPRMVDYVPSVQLKVQGVHERLGKLSQVRERMYVHWQKAVDSQKKYYDARHQWTEFQEGEIVGLSTKNFRFKAGRKLAPRFIPVRVTERIGRQAYRLQLPARYSRLHDVFPVSLLEKWPTAEGQTTLPLPELVDGEEEWDVEDIVEHKDVGGERRFLVKWAGWPAEYNTWEPREHLQNAEKVLRVYEKKAKQRHRKWDDES